jgi:ankyrin repeat protein
MEKEFFKLLKNHSWDKFKELIKKEKDKYNLNLRDEQNNYLINYAIIFNKKDIVKLLIDIPVKLDIIDTEGNNIMYLPIKLGYDKIFDLLNNNKDISIPLSELIDNNGYTAIFYAVMYNNYYCLKKLKKNINLVDNSNNSVLHLACKNNNIDMIKKLIEYEINTNLININNYTALHIACINKNIEIIEILIKYSNLNIKERQYDLVPLMYLLDTKYINLIKKMIEKGADVSSQDTIGNTVLHHAIYEGHIDVVNLLIDYYPDMSLVNIDGMTILHLCASKYSSIQFPYTKMINNIDLNLQDSKGNTCFHYLVMNNIWIHFIKELEFKQIDIFLKNIHDISVYDLNQSDELITLVAKGYIHNFKLSNKKLDEIKTNILNKKIRLSSESKILVLDKIKKVKTNTFIGIPLDIICGCILLKKVNNIYSTVNNSNIKLCEILWNYKELIVNDNIINIINNFKKDYLLILLGIELSHGAHANILLYDTKYQSIERFEPHGSEHPTNFYYNHELLDTLLEEKFKTIIPNIKYIRPKDYLPKIGFQSYESNEDKKTINDPEGYCVAWCLWYARQRVNNPDISQKILILKLYISIKKKTFYLKKLISSFAKEITDLRDDILKSNNVNINDWLYGDIDKSFIDKFII